MPILKSKLLYLILFTLFIGVFFILGYSNTKKSQYSNSPPSNNIISEPQPSILLAGGCFWCVESSLEKVPGIKEVISGYSDGNKQTAHYTLVSRGKTRHRESVLVYFDSSKISYKEVITHFLKGIDPTDTLGQFSDRGNHYKPAIYYKTPLEKKEAWAAIKKIENQKVFQKPIIVPIIKYTNFFPAEEYHQNYYKKTPSHYNRYFRLSGRGPFIKKHWGGKTK